MGRVLTRLAKVSDFAELDRKLYDSGYDAFAFELAPCVVAECDGLLVGMLPIRLRTDPVPIWQPEPLLVWAEPKSLRRRVMYLLWKGAEAWIRGERNQTGIKRYLAISFQDSVKQLFLHGGLTRLAGPEREAFAHLSTDEGAEFFFRQL